MICVLLDGNLDLENFGKKKKKKKKPFNMEELDGALPESGSKSKDDGNIEIDGNQDESLVEVLQRPVCYF
jgi:translation initiation factor 2 subunit 2